MKPIIGILLFLILAAGCGGDASDKIAVKPLPTRGMPKAPPGSVNEGGIQEAKPNEFTRKPRVKAAIKAFEEGRYRDAVRFYSTELTAEEKKESPSWRMIWLLKANLGLSLGATGEYDTALENCREALAIAIKQLGPNHIDVLKIYNNLGEVYHYKAEYDHALECYQRALDGIRNDRSGGNFFKFIEGEENRDFLEISVRRNMGLVHRDNGEYDKASENLHIALDIIDKRIEDENSQTPFGTQDYDFSFLSRRCKLAVAFIYHALGSVCVLKGEHELGFKHLEYAWRAYSRESGEDHPNAAACLSAIGGVFNAKGDNDKALEYYQKALAIDLKQLGADHPSIAISYIGMGAVYRKKGAYDHALNYHQKALAILLKNLNQDHPDVADAYQDIGLSQLGLKNLNEALAAARKARAIKIKQLAFMFSFTSEQERLAYQQVQAPYDLFASLGSASDLAKTILQNKAMVLSSLLEDQLAAEASSDPKIKTLVADLRAASQQLYQLETEDPTDRSVEGWEAHRVSREASRTKVEELQRRLARNVTGFGEARASFSLTLKDVQGSLARDAALVEYITYKHYQGKDQFESRYGAIILPKTGKPKWILLGPAESINQLLSKYSPLKPTDDEAYEEVLRGLHDQLMAPVLKELPKGIQTLILSPDGPLNFLSFATLLTDEDTFLCEEYTLKYVSSGRDLVKEFTPSQGSLAVFANPAYTEEPIQLASVRGSVLHFKPLPGTRKEADYLKSKAKDWSLEADVYEGQQATEASISRLKNPRILHLATHGFFLPEPQKNNKSQQTSPVAESGKSKIEQDYFVDPFTGQKVRKPPTPWPQIYRQIIARAPKKTHSENELGGSDIDPTTGLPVGGHLSDRADPDSLRQAAWEESDVVCLFPNGIVKGAIFEPFVQFFPTTNKIILPSLTSTLTGGLPGMSGLEYLKGTVSLGTGRAEVLREFGLGIVLELLDPATGLQISFREKATDYIVPGKDFLGLSIDPVSGLPLWDIEKTGIMPLVGSKPSVRVQYDRRFRNPMHRSGLAFAGAQKTLDAWARGGTARFHWNDGILTATEASVLDLKGTWLVTLSACETGRGEARSGEGVLGLRRAFIQAGAQNLLMTLWPVDDKQTIPFMKEFYERAMADGDAPESLAKVQTERLVKLRDVLGTRLAVQFAGPFIMSFQGAE